MVNKKVISIGGLALVLLVAGYLYLDSILFDGVKPEPISVDDLVATFYAKKDVPVQTAIILIGGGVWGDYWGQELAKANYAGLSLTYYRAPGLPELPEEIPLEYFKKAVDWLKAEVDPEKIILMGASRNAELALLVASYYPESIQGVIAYSPSSVSWSNTVMPFNSDEIKPSWTIQNAPVPFIPMPKLRVGESDTIQTLSYWKQGLSDTITVNQALIQVEKINGPVLLLSGLDDAVWPSAGMSDMIEERLMHHSFAFEVENIQYENSGHLISGNPNNLETTRYREMMIDGRSYVYGFGGTADGDMTAKQDAARRVFDFLSKVNNE